MPARMSHLYADLIRDYLKDNPEASYDELAALIGKGHLTVRNVIKEYQIDFHHTKDRVVARINEILEINPEASISFIAKRLNRSESNIRVLVKEYNLPVIIKSVPKQSESTKTEQVKVNRDLLKLKSELERLERRLRIKESFVSDGVTYSHMQSSKLHQEIMELKQNVIDIRVEIYKLEL